MMTLLMNKVIKIKVMEHYKEDIFIEREMIHSSILNYLGLSNMLYVKI